MGFNKKLLDHFSETLRCNQYPKRYLGDKAKIYNLFAESDTFCLLYQLGDMLLNFREHKKGKYFHLSDSASRMHFMVHLWHHIWWKGNNNLNKCFENSRKTHMQLNISSWLDQTLASSHLWKQISRWKI
jgi:hypothetical protein